MVGDRDLFCRSCAMAKGKELGASRFMRRNGLTVAVSARGTTGGTGYDFRYCSCLYMLPGLESSEEVRGA